MALNPTEHDSTTSDVRIADLYRAASREESPRHVDLALLAAAREPLAVRRPPKSRWWASWQLPFALAAVGVVSVSLVALMMDEGGDRVARLESRPDRARPPLSREDAPTEAPPVASSAEPAADAQAPLERLPKRAASPKPNASAAGASADSSGSQQREGRAARDTVGAPNVMAPAAPAEVPPPSPESRQYSAAPAATPPVATSATSAKVEPEGRVAEERPPSPPLAARSAPLSSAEPQLRRRETGAGALSAAPSREFERHVRELEREKPQAWIQRIQLLRREGRSAEAKELLVEFRRRFPEEVLPHELR